MGTTPPITTNNPQNTRSTKPDQATTMRMCDATERQGNCMRHSQIAHQAAARQCPGTVNAVAANDPPKPHRDGPRGHTQARDDTTTFSTVFPAPASWKRATQPPLFAYPPRWRSPPSTATFPRQQANKSLHDQHVVSILHVGAHRLQQRLSRASKPTSRYTTITFCPSSSLVPNNLNTDFPASISRKVTPPATRSVL